MNRPARIAIILLTLTLPALGGCVVGTVVGTTVGVAGAAVGATAKVAGAAVGATADVAGAGVRTITGSGKKATPPSQR